MRNLGDPVAGSDRRYRLTGRDILISKEGTPGDPFGPYGSHNNYDKDSSGLGGYNNLPRVSTVTPPCYEIDLTTLQGFRVPDLVSRVTGTSRCPPGPPKKCLWATATSIGSGSSPSLRKSATAAG